MRCVHANISKEQRRQKCTINAIITSFDAYEMGLFIEYTSFCDSVIHLSPPPNWSVFFKSDNTSWSKTAEGRAISVNSFLDKLLIISNYNTEFIKNS